MKTILLLIICFIALSISPVKAQEADQPNSTKGQKVLPNDFYAGYGAGGLFYWTGRMAHTSGYPSETGSQKFSNPSSIGAFLLGYNRSLSNVISVGFLFGLQNFTYTGTISSTLVKTDYQDLLLGGMARVLFCYLNKPAVHMYSGIGLGVTMNFGTATQTTGEVTDRKLFPGGQLTLMGIRFGRALGGFVEFGIGTIGIFNGGISYKFSD